MAAGEELTRFCVDPASSAVLVEARSNVGVVTFGTTDVRGEIRAVACPENLDTRRECSARITLPLASLTSGNGLYDAELQQRLVVHRYPEVVVELVRAEPVGGQDHHLLGTVTLHGVTATLQGDVRVSVTNGDTVSIVGESVIDVRDFDIAVPSVLMLRIYPEVKVSLQLLARTVCQQERGA